MCRSIHREIKKGIRRILYSDLMVNKYKLTCVHRLSRRCRCRDISPIARPDKSGVDSSSARNFHTRLSRIFTFKVKVPITIRRKIRNLRKLFSILRAALRDLFSHNQTRHFHFHSNRPNRRDEKIDKFNSPKNPSLSYPPVRTSCVSCLRIVS